MSDSDQLTESINEIPGIKATARRGVVLVDVGGGIPHVHLRPDAVEAWRYGRDPRGAPAMQLRLRPTEAADVTPVYLTAGDVAFAPDGPRASRDIRPHGPEHVVQNMPPLVAYTEMLHTVRQTEEHLDTDLDRRTGTVLMVVAFWRGAQRVGLDVDDLAPTVNDLLTKIDAPPPAVGRDRWDEDRRPWT